MKFKIKNTIFILLIVLLSINTFSEEKKKLTFEQAFAKEGDQLIKDLPDIIEWKDDCAYYELKNDKLIIVNAKDGEEKKLLNLKNYKIFDDKKLDIKSAEDRTDDFNKFLFTKDGDIYLFSVKNNKLKRLTKTKTAEKNPRFSPDGSKIAYTVGGDLYAYEIDSGKTKRFTSDGSEVILNGYASWVYYEEIIGRRSRYKAFWWSPDSKKIIFLRFDQSDVPVFPIVRSKGDYGEVERQYYPKPGYPNPTVKIGIADIESATVNWINFKDENDHYLAFPVWSDDSRYLYFQWMNRGQDHIKILRSDLSGKNINIIYEEKQDHWVDFFGSSDLYICKNSDIYLISSRDGWYHIYYIDKGGSKQQLTTGDWSVKEINFIDEKKGDIYFRASKEDSTEIDFYKLSVNDNKITRLTEKRGYHTINISREASFFIDRYSSVDFPPVLELRDTQGKLIRKLGDSYSEKSEEYALGKYELFRIPTSDGYDLPALWLLPPDFDENNKYPVIFRIYGGPGASIVYNAQRTRGRLGMHYVAQQGIIQISVDHRGSGHFGKKEMNLMHRNLGKWELHDYIEAVKYLRTLPFVDPERIGITGGSYGGYVTTLALVSASEYFKYGDAGASVIDWKLYDSVYTERYMDTPKENPEGYKKGSVLNYIDKYKGGLRITHGTMDDNVHMQNTIQFIDKLIDAEKSVEFMLYPGQRHGYRGKKRYHDNKERVNFWLENFFNRRIDEN